MKITCTDKEQIKLCGGATLCSFITRNDHCDEPNGCYKCREENIDWRIIDNFTDEKIEQLAEKEYTREDVIHALECGISTACEDCKFQHVRGCLKLRNKLAIKYLQSTTNEPNTPLTLLDLAKLMNEKKPVWIVGYGWYFIEKIVIDLDSTRIETHTHNTFIYTKDSTQFYRYEVK